MRVSEIRAKRIPVNQGLGVLCNLGQVLEVVVWKFPYWKVYGE